MSSPAQTTQNGPQRKQAPRRAVEVLGGKVRKAEPLYDAFWREFELALMFGEPGVGKSVLAMQISDALARGKPIAGFQMPEGRKARRKVLYVDLVLTDEQFADRYGRYRFSANLYHERPAECEGLLEWLRETIEAHDFKVVIVDDLSMVSRTNDGTRETLELMHELRRLAADARVSILVLADSFPLARENALTERGLRRSRVLCGVADSVFGIAFGGETRTSAKREIAQTRSRSGELVWSVAEPATCTIAELDSGLVGMKFRSHDLSPDRVDLIREIRELHEDEGRTFRAIAEDLGISKTTAQRLYKQSRELGHFSEEAAELVDPEEEDESPEDKLCDRYHGKRGTNIATGRDPRHGIGDPPPGYEDWLGRYFERLRGDGTGRERAAQQMREIEPVDDPRPEETVGHDLSRMPFAAGLRRRSITDLERAYDADGEEIFVEKWYEHTYKPAIWYKRRRTGFSRHERGTWGVNVKKVTDGDLP